MAFSSSSSSSPLSSSSLSQFLDTCTLLEQNKTKKSSLKPFYITQVVRILLASRSDFIFDTQQLVDFQLVSWRKQTTLATKRLIPM
jgi:hypothetical protein